MPNGVKTCSRESRFVSLRALFGKKAPDIRNNLDRTGAGKIPPSLSDGFTLRDDKDLAKIIQGIDPSSPTDKILGKLLPRAAASLKIYRFFLKLKMGHTGSLSGGEEGMIVRAAPDGLNIDAVGLTSRGLRENNINEDGLSITRLDDGSILFQVADGMGGHTNGALASHFVLQKMSELLKTDHDFVSAAQKTQQQIRNGHIHEDSGTTYSGVILSPGKKGGRLAEIWTAGDSPVMVLRNGKLIFITTPDKRLSNDLQTLPSTKLLQSFRSVTGISKLKMLWIRLRWVFRTPKLKKQIAEVLSKLLTGNAAINLGFRPANIICNCFGDMMPRVDEREPDRVKLKKGDYLVLASDGASDNWSPKAIAKTLKLAKKHPLYETSILIGRAIVEAQTKGHMLDTELGRFQAPPSPDNYTFWLIPIK